VFTGLVFCRLGKLEKELAVVEGAVSRRDAR
jgi:hypothetical protein